MKSHEAMRCPRCGEDCGVPCDLEGVAIRPRSKPLKHTMWCGKCEGRLDCVGKAAIDWYSEVERPPGLAHEWDYADRWWDIPLAAIDFETTGLVSGRDKIVEIGISCWQAGVEVGRHTAIVNPGIPIPMVVSQVHGIYDWHVVDEPTMQEMVLEVQELLVGFYPVAYNAPFDRRFLHAECRNAAGAPAFRPGVDWVDPLRWVRKLHGKINNTLVEVCGRYGVSLENAHTALDDASATGALLVAMRNQLPITIGELINPRNSGRL